MIRRFALASAILIAAGSAASAAPAMAGTATSDINVSATVPVNCTISTDPIAFGNYDPIVAHANTNRDENGSVRTTCTSGASAVITLSQGANPAASSTNAAPLRRLSNGDGGLLEYKLYSSIANETIWGNTSGTGLEVTGTGQEVTSQIFARIPLGQNVPSGNYTDTVTATIAY